MMKDHLIRKYQSIRMYKNNLIDLLSTLFHSLRRSGRARTAEERERRAAEYLKSVILHARMRSF